MARNIVDDQTNVDPADSDYPYGRVRDKVPGTPGTKHNETLYGDMIQFFQKLMAEAGITPNHLPDNEYTGWQLYEAFDALVNPAAGQWHEVGEAGEPAFASSWVNDSPSTQNKLAYRINGDWLEFRGAVSGGSTNTTVFTLPVSFRTPKLCIAVAPIGGVLTDVALIATSNASGGLVNIKYGGSGIVYFDGIRFPLS